MNEVFYAQEDIIEVTETWIMRLKAAADTSPLKRARLCLHRSIDDQVQEMIIVLRNEILFRPHRHLEKSESFHMIEGHLFVLIFNDDATVVKSVEMGPVGTGRVFCYRLSSSQWHAIVPISDVVVFHESTRGPFVKGDADFADWAPTDQNELRKFLYEHLRQAIANNT